METLEFKNEVELKRFVSKNRKIIKSINGLDVSGIYPMLSITNKNVSYYDVDLQRDKSLFAPFTVVFNH